MLENVIQIRCPMVCCYAVRVNECVYLIDTGFVGGVKAIERALDQEGWRGLPVKGILLTHGHLDHTLNAASLAERHQAWVVAPAADRLLLNGDFRVTGLGWVGGAMQQLGAVFFHYRKVEDITWYEEDALEVFPDGLSTVKLPGHTAGHSGFLFGRHLFCGDVFASFGAATHLSPRIFNEDTELAKKSLLEVAKMDIDGVFPHHCDRAPPEIHLERLRGIAAKI